MGEVERAVFPTAEGEAAGGLELRCVVFARSADRLVLVRRPKDPVYGDAWTLPGGTLFYGVHPRRGATQLLREQVGVSPQWVRLFGVRSSMSGDWILTFQFEAEVGPLPPEGEPSDVKLANLEADLPADVHPLSKTDLEMYHVLRLARGAPA